MNRKNKRIPKDTARIDWKDAQKPIDISVIGTEDDPCFGKLYEPVTEECSGCGDSELCAIVHMHTLDSTRTKIEKKKKFKDKEKAASAETFMSTTKLQAKIESKLSKSKKPIRFSKIVRMVSKKYDPQGLLPPGRISELLKYAIKSSDTLKTKKKDGKIYVRYVG